MFFIVGSAAAAFVLSILCGIIFIPILRRLKFGQEIREEGPKWHKKKSGTPTMGGFIFIVPVMVVLLALCVLSNLYDYGKESFALQILLILGISIAFGAIGFIDDYIKVVMKRNLGLTAIQKFSLQLVAAVVFSIISVKIGVVNSEIIIPFMSSTLNVGILYIPFIVIVMLACVNSVNLTDGLDGLATSVTIAASLFFMLASALIEHQNSAVLIFTSTLIGGLFGFLIYNKCPASVFMGDTGSLFLGGAVSAMAIMLKMPIILLIVGFVYVMESLSVILQVASFKLTGKRIFKMSPIHHHFEMCGWSERKIVLVFTLVTIFLGFIGYLMIK